MNQSKQTFDLAVELNVKGRNGIMLIGQVNATSREGVVKQLTRELKSNAKKSRLQILQTSVATMPAERTRKKGTRIRWINVELPQKDLRQPRISGKKAIAGHNNTNATLKWLAGALSENPSQGA